MQNSQTTLDAAAIGLSLVCVTHCLVSLLPILLLQSLGAAFLEDERIHFGIAMFVLPTSIFALSLGFRKHGKYAVAITGLLGLFVLLSVLIIGKETLGEIGEKLVTVVGTIFIAYAHIQNFLLGRSQSCRSLDDSG